MRKPPEPPAVPDTVWINPPAPYVGPEPRIPGATGPPLQAQRLSGSTIDDLEGGRQLDTPQNEATAVSRRALTAGVRQ